MINFILCKVLLVCLLVSASTEGKDCPPECQLNQVRTYFHALDKVFREGSTAVDVDDLLSTLHDSVRYVHIDYEADFDKKSWRAAIMGNLEHGAYKNGPEQQIGITNVIHGKNHMAVEYSHGVNMPDGTWKGDKPLLAIFRFTDAKISLIEELW